MKKTNSTIKDKKIICTLKKCLSLTLIVSLFAFNIVSVKGYENNYEEILLNNGFPEEIIDTMSTDEIKYQAENNFIYEDTTTQYFSFLSDNG